MKLNPMKYAQQHPKQLEATKALQPIRALFWGNRVGKTEWGAQESVRYSTGTHPFKKIIIPNDGWVISPSFDLQLEGTQKKLEKYIGSNEIEHIDYLRSSIWKSLRLKCGSLMTFKTYEQGREKFQSAAKRWIWFDEEPPSDIYEECVVRQEAGIPLDIWITMTPINGMTWIYDDIYSDTGNPLYYISEAEWNDNPYLTDSQKNIMRGILEKRGQSLEVREKGHFVSRVGLVCSWWRREKHLREYKSFPVDWSYFEIFDGGWTDPATWLLIGIDNLGDINILDGFKETELLTEDIKEKRKNKVLGLVIRKGISDNDNPRLNKELSKPPDGISLIPIEKTPNEKKSWDETMAEAMASFGRIQKGTGEPRLFINKNLTWLIQQIENLKWLEQKKVEGVEILPKWNDHRKFGHHFDGVYDLAYFCTDYLKPLEKETLPYNRSKWSI